MNALEALRQLQSELSAEPDDIPHGWMTDRQWAQEAGLSDTTASRILRRGVDAGSVERRTFRLRMDAGSIRAVKHYRVVEKSKGKK